MALPAGFNFRLTAGFVTDVSPDVYAQDPGSPPVAAYPFTYSNGITGGWEIVSGSLFTDGRDRDAATSPHLAGMQVPHGPDETQFRLDLPTPGNYYIQAAFGDFSNPQTSDISLYDANRQIAKLAGDTPADSYLDATNVVLTNAAWQAGTNSRGGRLEQLFDSTILRAHFFWTLSRACPICHLYIAQAPTVVPRYNADVPPPVLLHQGGIPNSALRDARAWW